MKRWPRFVPIIHGFSIELIAGYALVMLMVPKVVEN